LAAFLSLVLAEVGYKGARLIGTLASISLFLLAMSEISELLMLFSPLLSAESIKSPIKLALKVVGVGYTVGICRDTVEELGQKGLAGALMTVGRIEILLLAAPEIIRTVRLALSLI
jgi:hypothetical protein